MIRRVGEDAAGMRLDAFLAREDGDDSPALSRSAAAKLIEAGGVTLNGKPADKKDRVTPGDLVEYILPEPEPIDAQPEDIPLDVVYEDKDLLVINKPSGMVVHPAPGNPSGTLVNALLYRCKGELSGINGALRPGIVHRIDRQTSGLLVVAKTTRPTASWRRSLKDITSRANITRWCRGAFPPIRGPSICPSDGIPSTARKWR